MGSWGAETYGWGDLVEISEHILLELDIGFEIIGGEYVEGVELEWEVFKVVDWDVGEDGDEGGGVIEGVFVSDWIKIRRLLTVFS